MAWPAMRGPGRAYSETGPPGPPGLLHRIQKSTVGSGGNYVILYHADPLPVLRRLLPLVSRLTTIISQHHGTSCS